MAAARPVLNGGVHDLAERNRVRKTKPRILRGEDMHYYTIVELLWVQDADARVRREVREWYDRYGDVCLDEFKHFKFNTGWYEPNLPVLGYTARLVADGVEYLTWKVFGDSAKSEQRTREWVEEFKLALSLYEMRARTLTILSQEKETIGDLKRFGRRFDPESGREALCWGVNNLFVALVSNWLDELRNEVNKLDALNKSVGSVESSRMREADRYVYERFVTVCEPSILLEMYRTYVCNRICTEADRTLHFYENKISGATAMEILFVKNNKESALPKDQDIKTLHDTSDPVRFRDFMFEYAYAQRMDARLKYDHYRVPNLFGLPDKDVVYRSVSELIMAEGLYDRYIFDPHDDYDVVI